MHYSFLKDSAAFLLSYDDFKKENYGVNDIRRMLDSPSDMERAMASAFAIEYKMDIDHDNLYFFDSCLDYCCIYDIPFFFDMPSIINVPGHRRYIRIKHLKYYMSDRDINVSNLLREYIQCGSFQPIMVVLSHYPDAYESGMLTEHGEPDEKVGDIVKYLRRRQLKRPTEKGSSKEMAYAVESQEQKDKLVSEGVPEHYFPL